jgi:hypothetical protein
LETPSDSIGINILSEGLFLWETTERRIRKWIISCYRKGDDSMITGEIMNEFILVFRMDITTKEAQPTPAQMEMYMEKWGEWISDIAMQGRLADGGNHLSAEGRVLKSNNIIIDGPYTEKNESIAGYIIVKATSFDEAINIAKECPILQGEGTSVEVREIGSM